MADRPGDIMKKVLIALMIVATSLSIAVSEAQAKRLGGGGSFGKQSSGVSRQAPSQAAKPATPPAAAPQAPPVKPPSPWRGILGGALLGLGLGALLSHFGLGGAMASMISTILMVALLAFAVMFIYRMFRRKSEPASGTAAFAGGYSGNGGTPEIGSRLGSAAQPHAFQPDSAMAGESTTPWGVPADFDVPAFLRNAKTYYIRLQAAWDSGNVNDIREFTTPEMFGELRLQLQERGASANHTDVVSLEADLLGVERVGDDYLASVKFTGMIKEDLNAAAEPFAEVWNLSKPVSGQGGWVLAGIQQLS
jgi:predicted lipid-binding transport protein (Tim44 family)